MKIIVLAAGIFLLAVGPVRGEAAAATATFTVSGASLRDANNHDFVIRGVNVPLLWFFSDVYQNISAIHASTGANALRLVWSTSATYPDSYWHDAIQRTIDNRMIPILELHDATGSNDPQRLKDLASWWASKASYLKQASIARYVLINLANEWSDWFMASPDYPPEITVWRDAYKAAITIIRNSGIRSTIVIDGAAYGQDVEHSLLAYGQELLNHDPRHNLLFSVHFYCEWADIGKVEAALQAMRQRNLPVVIGEFGNNHPPCGDLPFVDVMRLARQYSIGYIPWSWKGNTTGVLDQLDMSRNWSGSALTAWGNALVNGVNGIRNTAHAASVFGN